MLSKFDKMMVELVKIFVVYVVAPCKKVPRHENCRQKAVYSFFYVVVCALPLGHIIHNGVFTRCLDVFLICTDTLKNKSPTRFISSYYLEKTVD